MTKFMKKLIFGFAAGMLLVTPALAEDRKDCIDSLTNVVEAMDTIKGVVVPVPAADVATIINKLGPPPVKPPYTMSFTKAENRSALMIHDNECVLLLVPPTDDQVIENFLGHTNS